ncbi:peptidase [Grosmannia clavigera kw1407]|uniref:Xaa-Pro aminopeptidase n=1 Tax=Grosmannia clavigera (strain kw1407 / UAMH 11150) TaxID=655863 RepID=F0XFA1_GROCL|nr:peptidase [Grosmannia clavigera kw1407]EFX03974.1 peptidase [Grosmannia clavigera kw1407]
MVFGRRKKGASSAANGLISHDLVFVEEFDALSIEVKLGTALAAPHNASLKFPAKLHARKVAKELGIAEGLIYLPGLPSLVYEDSDMGPAFRQRRYFYYLGGVDYEDCAVTYDLASDNLVLWVPYIDPRQVLWYGSGPKIEECKQAVDIDDVRYVQDLDGFLRKRLGVSGSGIVSASVGSSFCCDRKGLRVANADSARPSPTVLLVLHPDQVPAWLRQDVSGFSSVRVDTRKLQPAMDSARVVKTAYEIAQIRQANDVSSSAHREVLHRLKGLSNEREIEAVFLNHCLAVYGAKHQSYGVIAGSGANASVLHYFTNDEPLAGRQLVCLDAGAEWKLYASDVTRTFPISGVFTAEAAAIYAAVDRMQTEVIEQFQPGVAFRDLHLHAASVAAEELLRLGILKNATVQQIVAAGTIAAFFPHGLGHHVGLEVHDVLSPELMAAAPKASAAARESQEMEARAAAAASSIPALSSLSGRGTNARGKRLLVTPHMYATLARDAAIEAERAAVMSSVREKRRLLEPGMIITVEPGIYFCRPYIEAFFLADPSHARFIDKDVLERYYAVGGVRIEDCLLVTEDGHEDLTTAPKGEEALRIINSN